MRAQVVLNQDDLFGVGKLHVGQLLERSGVIDGGVMVGDLDAAPAFQRGERQNMLATPLRSYS